MELAAAGEYQGPALHVAVPAQVLGRRVQDDVGPQLQGPLQHGRGKGVVHHREGAGPAAQAGGGGQVHHLEQGVRGALQPDDAGLGTERRGQGPEVLHAHEVGADPPVGEDLLGGHPETVVGVVGEDDVGARRQRLQQGHARGHAGGEDEGRLPPFEGGEGRLELVLVGVRLADVGVTAERHALGIAGEGGGEDDGRGHRARRGIDAVAGVNDPGLEFHPRSLPRRADEKKGRRLAAPALEADGRAGLRRGCGLAPRSSGWRPSAGR